MLNNKIDKMSLIGNWHIEDIEQENLTFSVFLTAVRSKTSNIHNRHKVLISKFVEIAKKEYAQSCKQLFYLNELSQITWCVYAKQKNGRATDLTIASYENRFNYSFDFDSLMVESRVKRMIRLCFVKFSKYQKLPVIYLNIYHRDIGLSKRYRKVTFTSTGLKFSMSAKC